MSGISYGLEEKVVLVTGGAGAIGGNLVRRLDELGTDKVVIIDDLSSSYEWNIPRGERIQFSAVQADGHERPARPGRLGALFVRQQAVQLGQRSVGCFLVQLPPHVADQARSQRNSHGLLGG